MVILVLFELGDRRGMGHVKGMDTITCLKGIRGPYIVLDTTQQHCLVHDATLDRVHRPRLPAPMRCPQLT